MKRLYPTGESSGKKVIVLQCTDDRFAKPQHKFVKEELGLQTHYYKLVRAGGALSIARRGMKKMKKHFISLLEEIDTLLKHSEVTHLVIINHEDCKRYDDVIDRETEGSNAERDDLMDAALYLTGKYPKLQIGAYYAHFANKKRTKVMFTTIFESNKRLALPLRT
jgi:hypothetical protein